MRRTLRPTRPTRIGGHFVTPTDLLAQCDDGGWYVIRPVADSAVAEALSDGAATETFGDAVSAQTTPAPRLRLA